MVIIVFLRSLLLACAHSYYRATAAATAMSDMVHYSNNALRCSQSRHDSFGAHQARIQALPNPTPTQTLYIIPMRAAPRAPNARTQPARLLLNN